MNAIKGFRVPRGYGGGGGGVGQFMRGLAIAPRTSFVQTLAPRMDRPMLPAVLLSGSIVLPPRPFGLEGATGPEVVERLERFALTPMRALSLRFSTGVWGTEPNFKVSFVRGNGGEMPKGDRVFSGEVCVDFPGDGVVLSKENPLVFGLMNLLDTPLRVDWLLLSSRACAR